MGSDDPSQVDTETLYKSLRRDLFEAQKLLQQGFDFISQAHVTLNELDRRQQSADVQIERMKAALKPFAELSAKLPDEGVVVEVCRPDPQNPSPRIEPFLTKHLRTAAGLV
jgi:hypothetical protein